MTPNGGIWKRQLTVLSIATSLLIGCAAVDTEPGTAAVCPPVVEYSRQFQAQADEEMALLPEGSVIVVMLSDYAVMREQLRVCS